MSLGTLGDGDTKVTFEASHDRLRTWSEFEREGASRWADHEVYAGQPVSEFIGPGLDDVNLQVRFDIDRGVVPKTEIENLRKLRDTGAVLPLVIGGVLAGDYTLRHLHETFTRFDSKGVLLVATVRLTLKEYH
jgi:phage protein U